MCIHVLCTIIRVMVRLTSTYMHVLSLSHTLSLSFISVTHTHTHAVQEASTVDPSLHQPDKDLLNKLKDVYVESTTNTVTVSKGSGQVSVD